MKKVIVPHEPSTWPPLGKTLIFGVEDEGELKAVVGLLNHLKVDGKAEYIDEKEEYDFWVEMRAYQYIDIDKSEDEYNKIISWIDPKEVLA